MFEPEPLLAAARPSDSTGTFRANDFKLPTTITRIIVVQNLPRLYHNVSLPPGSIGVRHAERTCVLFWTYPGFVAGCGLGIWVSGPTAFCSPFGAIPSFAPGGAVLAPQPA